MGCLDWRWVRKEKRNLHPRKAGKAQGVHAEGEEKVAKTIERLATTISG